MFQIGQFSIITRLSIKTLRYYHNEGILMPDYIDEDSGYRYYRISSVDKARIISMLRNMEFSINDIKEILSNFSEDEEVIDFLEKQRGKIKKKINNYQKTGKDLQSMIDFIRSNEMNEDNYTYDIKEKFIDDFIFTGHRFTGTYSEVGKAFGIVAKAAGRQINGKAMSLYYDGEYKTNNADIEGGFPVSKEINGENITCRILKGGKAVTIIHKGPYENLGKSYEKLFDYIEEKNYETLLPSREIYIKGPGMIFCGNPKKYITELQVLIKN